MARIFPVKGELTPQGVLLERSNGSNVLFDRGSYGSKGPDKRIELSLVEAYYLINEEKLEVHAQTRALDAKGFLTRAQRRDRRFRLKYTVYADLRKKGFILKTALKYGADFRVYEKGIRPGQDHSTWLLFVVPEKDFVSMTDFVGKNRIAHSTRKRLLIGIVDHEHSVTFYESSWVKL